MLENYKNSEKELQEFAHCNNFVGAFFSSAKTGLNVSESFEFLLKTIIKKLEDMQKKGMNIFVKGNVISKLDNYKANKRNELIKNLLEKKEISKNENLKNEIQNENVKNENGKNENDKNVKNENIKNENVKIENGQNENDENVKNENIKNENIKKEQNENDENVKNEYKK